MTLTPVELGEVEGALTPNLTEGTVFTATAKGAVKLKNPTNCPAGVVYVELVIAQDSKGGHAITSEGPAWISAEPIFNTAANAVNVLQLVTFNGGTTWYALGPEQGKEGPHGAEGFSASKLLLPSAVKTYKEPGTTESENRKALAETLTRAVESESIVLTSGTPVIAAIATPPKTLISGVGFFVNALEGTPANRTHLWVALLNSAGEVLRRGLDYTASEHTPLSTSRLYALRLASSYETGSEGELLYAVLCEVMSSTSPIAIECRAGNTALGSETTPALTGTGNTGQTTPEGLPSTVTISAYAKVPYMVFV